MKLGPRKAQSSQR